MNKNISKFIFLYLAFTFSGCNAAANQEGKITKNQIEETKLDFNCEKISVPTAPASPAPTSPPPTSPPIPKDWKNKSVEEIYIAITSHPCNKQLMHDVMVVIGAGAAPARNSLSKSEKVEFAKRAATADAYRQAAEIISEIYINNNLKVRSFIYSYDEDSKEIRKDMTEYIKRAEILSSKITEGDIVEIELKFTDFYRTIASFITD